jgi:hypothetical protein
MNKNSKNSKTNKQTESLDLLNLGTNFEFSGTTKEFLRPYFGDLPDEAIGSLESSIRWEFSKLVKGNLNSQSEANSKFKKLSITTASLVDQISELDFSFQFEIDALFSDGTRGSSRRRRNLERELRALQQALQTRKIRQGRPAEGLKFLVVAIAVKLHTWTGKVTQRQTTDVLDIVLKQIGLTEKPTTQAVRNAWAQVKELTARLDQGEDGLLD